MCLWQASIATQAKYGACSGAGFEFLPSLHASPSLTITHHHMSLHVIVQGRIALEGRGTP